MLSKSTSYVFMPGFFRLAGELGIGWLGSLPNGCREVLGAHKQLGAHSSLNGGAQLGT